MSGYPGAPGYPGGYGHPPPQQQQQQYQQPNPYPYVQCPNTPIPQWPLDLLHLPSRQRVNPRTVPKATGPRPSRAVMAINNLPLPSSHTDTRRYVAAPSQLDPRLTIPSSLLLSSMAGIMGRRKVRPSCHMVWASSLCQHLQYVLVH